ncbi:MAG: SET domain-containing protein-lysine N-methyltransferase [Paraburkholderia sp.]|uniref:SET domain-containing protein-lysine N-methyltransferase n=1 Tax=Paraburkholderia sp. TaxID=1926495 RepID=UPI0012099A5B|nr:SET domain-containing protein-lysine N-methyltransferase [Paraburkholderia sp.]TAM02190.1 MAG: SET domain-containing protein-lysine N-methyltransferase [Paraburkholderia sp.]TAM28122.1 MAG: SET domain-containing protein-lysine N-methyltransferase [Paraburkholderia sp.]
MSDVTSEMHLLQFAKAIDRFDQPVAREKIMALEREIQKMPQVDCPVRHYFAPGMYAREMTIPAGVAVTGAVHRHEHLCTVSKGRLLVLDDEFMREIQAPCTLVSKAGKKRVGYALEETVWTTYHCTTKTDLDEIMIEITESTNAELIGGRDNVQMRNNRAAEDRADYARFLVEYGLAQDVVTRLVENPYDQINVPIETLELRDSLIAGRGMFAKRDFNPDEFIAPARVKGFRTPAGRYLNHSAKPNARFVDLFNGNLALVANRLIRSGDEVVVDYRQAMRVNGAGFKPIGGEV